MEWNGLPLVVFDQETNGLFHDVSKIHCLSYCYISEPDNIITITNPDWIRNFFLREDIYRVGHNILMYDNICAEKLFNIKVPKNNIDTLALSWTLNFENKKHGLEFYGKYYNIHKTFVEQEQWSGLTDAEELKIELFDSNIKNEEAEKEYYILIEKRRKHLDLMKLRCETDVKINLKLWLDQYKHLQEIYDNDDKQIFRYIQYLEFKLTCIAYQMKVGIRFNEVLCRETLEKLEIEHKEKINSLKEILPPIPIKSIKNCPKVMFKKNGEVSAVGQKWLDFLKEQGLPEDHKEPVEYIIGWEEGNPQSVEQLKSFLYKLGWKPDHIQYKRDKKTNKVSEIPQIKHKDIPGEVSQSVKDLFAIEPKLEILEGVSILSHRISVFKGFINDAVNGRLYPTINGITNTLRVRHKIIVNLVSTKKLYGQQIRDCLMADEGYVLEGADIAGAEDSTKRHFIWKYDPEYVKEQMTEGFDPHLAIALIVGYVTQEDIEFYNNYSKIENPTKEEISRFKKIKDKRDKAKQVNFASIYNVGAPTLSRNMGISISEAEELLKGYWKKNWSVKEFANNLKIKTVRGKMWVQSPLNNYWLSLRKLSDSFSTVNQNSSAYLLDVWLSLLRKKDIFAIFQYQDELLVQCKKEQSQEVKQKIIDSMKELNDLLKLNVTIGCSVEIGQTYGQCH